MRSCWITYRGRRIFYGDFRDLGVEDLDRLEAELDEVEALVRGEPEDSVLMVCDIRGSVATTEAMAPWRAFTTGVAKHVHKLAALGISGFKKVLFDALVRLSGINAAPFDDLDVAQSWLIRQR